LRFAPFEQLMDGVTVDTHRRLRTGTPETIFAQGKSMERLLAAIRGLAGEDGKQPVLISRADQAQGEALLRVFPGGHWCREAGLFSLGVPIPLTPPWPDRGDLMVLTAGTSDMPVALEALGTAVFHGVSAGLAPDTGVAGLHRLRPWLPILDKARVLIVAAGMEGALPSVVAGLTGKPVLAVPTSVGYGAAAGGYAALLGMLSSCSPGIAVCNIDNGYGAAMFACRVLAGSGAGPFGEALPRPVHERPGPP
jgi:NCAIR mutase (PurE)-related protein